MLQKQKLTVYWTKYCYYFLPFSLLTAFYAFQLIQWQSSQVLELFVGGFGWFGLVLGGCGWFCLVVGGLGWFWLVVCFITNKRLEGGEVGKWEVVYFMKVGKVVMWEGGWFYSRLGDAEWAQDFIFVFDVNQGNRNAGWSCHWNCKYFFGGL